MPGPEPRRLHRRRNPRFFAVVTILNADVARLAPSTYPPARDIISSVALTFFAFLGFGVVTFTAKDLREPSRQLPRAITIAIGLATSSTSRSRSASSEPCRSAK